MRVNLSRLFAFPFLFALSAFVSLPARAEWDYWALKAFGPFDERGIGLYRVDSTSGSETLMTTRCDEDPGINTCYQNIGSGTYVDSETGKFFLENQNGDFVSYDPVSDSWTEHGTSWASSYSSTYARPSVVGTADGSVKIELGGAKIYERKSNGEIHIGENSLVTKEEGGRQKMWATDANGDSIDIDIVNSSDFLINGKSVQGQIDSNAANISTNAKNISNLGTGIAASTSLTAALSALPAASSDSPISCGVGTGGYSDKFALGVGCAAQINQRLNANIAASHVFGGSVDYGEDSLDTVAARAGFVFKFGKIDDSPKVAARKTAELRDEVAQLREENEALRAESSMQQQINASLVARLERLERIASGQLSLLGDRASSD